DQLGVARGSTVHLNGSGSSDLNGDTLTYAWSLSRPLTSSAVLSSMTIVNPTFVADKKGTYVGTLVVNDGNVNSAQSTVTITVPNTAPVANAGSPQTVARGATVTLNGSGSSDVDNDTLTYAWTMTRKPAGSTAALSSATAVSPTFVADKVGTY